MGSKKSLVIGSIYRHPRPNANSFLDKLAKKLESYSLSKNTSVLLMGDINIDVSNISNSMSKKYLEVLSSVGFENLVDIPTRYGSSSQTVIDHIITNYDVNKITHGVLDYAITDHLPIFALIHSKPLSKERYDPDQPPVYWQKIDDEKKDVSG